MPQKVTPITHQRAHNLRHEPTVGEMKLWSRLRGHQLKNIHFRRQHPIGKYIVDICAPKEKLIIEVDGSQHLRNAVKDKERAQYLELRGYRILRFWNSDVINNIDGVIVEIERELVKIPPPSSPK